MDIEIEGIRRPLGLRASDHFRVIEDLVGNRTAWWESAVPTVRVCSPPALVPHVESPEERGTLAELMAVFPEVEFTWEGKPSGRAVEVGGALSPLFDYSRYRYKGRQEDLGQSLYEYDLAALSVDEESSYAWVHAYAAYRSGLRSVVVASNAEWEAAKHLATASKLDFQVSFEDRSLEFSDRAGSDLGTFVGRDKAWPSLKNVPLRILITAGEVPPSDEWRNQRNVRVLPKPTGGINSFWSTVRGFRDGAGRTSPDCAQAPSGSSILAPAGSSRLPCWWGGGEPRSDVGDSIRGPRGGQHAANGRRRQVAEEMLQRARRLAGSADSIADWIRCAVLAMDAVLLLRGKTPKMSLTAISLRHEYEVRAETAMIGGSIDFGVPARLGEIESEIDFACSYYAEAMRARASLDARATLLARLATIFSAAGQFEEAELVSARLRQVVRESRRPGARGEHGLPLESGDPRVRPSKWISYYLLKYGDHLVSDFSRFLGVLAKGSACVVAATMFLLVWAEPTCCPDLLARFMRSVELFFKSALDGGLYEHVMKCECGSPVAQGGLWLLTIACALAGLFHLGVFISYMYSLIARR